LNKIGIDIGMLFVKAVRLRDDGELLATFYERHHGDPKKYLEKVLVALEVRDGDALCLTGGNGSRFGDALSLPVADVTFCQIEAVTSQVPDVEHIIDIGGGSVTLIQLDGKGKFQGYETNSLCAAGTGSFLDEQAGRLGISYDEINDFAVVESPPNIATRCAVFAKSDLIHRQQEGCTRAEMWSGLCRGMTKTMLGTLLCGRPLQGKTVVIGGVALNREVLRWLVDAYPDLITIPENPHLMAALGAASFGDVPSKTPSLPIELDEQGEGAIDRFPWPLSMEKSQYPSFSTEEAYIDDEENEVRVTAWPSGGEVRGYMGIDIGSTSTKLVVIDDDRNVLIDIYRKTGGDPIDATKKLFSALNLFLIDRGTKLSILGAGTTGSGRKLVGSVIGADAVINEISAHVAGAVETDASIDTIFEIGGQDSKYMHLVDRHIRDANMNYVCAAGTGSFVEEQANKLGYRVSEAGPAVMGLSPPRATDRCTVFMEQDMAKLIQAGATPKEAFAAVMVAVAKNYLNKVVGNRYRSRDRIFFQGATARNPALVAAFERLLDVPIVVSPYCHVMGSFGVALLTRELMKESGKQESSFRGLDLEKRSISLRKEPCELCRNECKITYAEIEGVDEAPSWGYMCGRDPEEEKVRVSPHARLLRKRQQLWREAGRGVSVPDDAPVVGIPQALTTYSYFPLWHRFFNRLGYRVELSGMTTPEIRQLSTTMSAAEFCFPAKIVIGHLAHLALKDGVDFLFLPQMLSEAPREHVTASRFCPYSQAAPIFSRSAMKLNAINSDRLLAPLIDMRDGEAEISKTLANVLSKPLRCSVKQIQAAWRDALRVQRRFEARSAEIGMKAVEDARRKNEKLLVVVGRPYNLYDEGINLGLPKKLADYGRTVVPMDLLDLDLKKLGEKYRNSYWGYGQKILTSLEQIATDDLLDAVYFTNFICGPDSFLLTYAEEIMQNRPFLALELDEHGSDTGYMTRIEAFFDVLRRPPVEVRKRSPFVPAPDGIHHYKLWIPNMHPYTTGLFAAALRGAGFDAAQLPLETAETAEIGRSHTRGSECLPTALTIGSLLAVLKKHKGQGKHGFFMPTSQGPCRFGQYVSLHRQILDREGFTDVPIFSPTKLNGYQAVHDLLRQSLLRLMIGGDILLKAGCKIRPYEIDKGETDRRLDIECRRLEKLLEENGDFDSALRSAVENIASVPIDKREEKPLVGIVGEIYVRNNVFANEDVIRTVEQNGGEAWMVPIAEWLYYTSSPEYFLRNGDPFFSKKTFKRYMKWRFMLRWEKFLYNLASPLLDDRHEPPIDEITAAAKAIMPASIGGEAYLAIGRTIAFAKQNAALVVNCAPFGCMPGTVTTAVFRQLSVELGMPIVNVFYDGTGGQNRRLAVFLRNAIESAREVTNSS
jgi:predicted CoA-substrate-specific enzyme activase